MLSRQAIRSIRAAAPQRTLARTPVRAFATAAAPPQDVRPPVAVYGLDGTYATALVRQSHCETPIYVLRRNERFQLNGWSLWKGAVGRSYVWNNLY